MAKKIYVGNLPFSATEDDVRDLFAPHGTIHSVAMINDRDTGRFRGFGFVEMDDNEAESAIEALDGYDYDGRALRVNEARERTERPSGGSRGFGDRGGGRGNYGDRGGRSGDRGSRGGRSDRGGGRDRW